ncbi:MAG: hypothetical protein WD426_14485 [Anditalea sp.]
MSKDNQIPKDKAASFYKTVIELLLKNNFSFLIGGAFALRHYTDIYRDTKDLDIFCKPEDYPGMLQLFVKRGYNIEITDPRWLAKVFKGPHFVDFIFNTTNNICPVDDSWFKNSISVKLFGHQLQLMGAEEIIWTKLYVHNRERYDATDINHLILRYGEKIKWERLLHLIGIHWHLLLAQILNFQFVYPSDKGIVPSWLFKELLQLAEKQFDLPSPVTKVCLGPLIDHTNYEVDIKEWNYKSLTTKTV